MSKLSFSRGFTLIELMVTVSISAILVGIGAPMMTSVIERNAVAGHTNSFMGSISLARSEAIKRGVAVVMCRSDNPEAAAPVCASSGTAWVSGWIVFADRNNNGQMDSASANSDVLLRVQGAVTDSGGIAQNTFTNLVFRPTGLMSSGASTITFDSKSQNSSAKLCVCIFVSGRTRLLETSTDTCEA